MKFKKLLVLAGTAVMLMACGGNAKSTTPAASVEPATSTETASSEVVTPSTPAPVSVTPSSAAPASSSSATPAPSTATPSSSTQVATRYELSFRNTVASGDKSKTPANLTTYINGETRDGFCTGVTLEGSGEVESIDDSELGTFTILKIGASKNGGTLTFNFSVNIKSIILDVENYHKSYPGGSSQDTGVKLYVNDKNTVIDLSATAGNPTQKTQELTLNAKTFKLFTDGASQRAFVNGITFVL